jgi:peptidoglycan/xylan/chitin deacetylase (PgdA/CDA1 family)
MYLVRAPFLVTKLLRKTIWRKDSSDNKIYLTFDDGPIPVVTPYVLDLLKDNKVKATFFCVGHNVKNNPEIYNRIIAEGHSVGNHTYSHLNGWKTNRKKYLENVEECSTLVKSNLFRPPYGKLKPSQLSELNKNYSVIMWDVLSGDYDFKTGKRKCYANVISKVRNGSIIVFHDSLKSRINLEYVLPRFIAYAKGEGFKFEKL